MPEEQREKLTLPCGCWYNYDMADPGWKHCEKHERDERAELALETAFGVPTCPECHSDARRPKCMWELGGGCPRHSVMDAWTDAKKAAARLLRHMEEGG